MDGTSHIIGNSYNFGQFTLSPMPNPALILPLHPEPYAIYPFIHSFSNIRRSADQLRPVMIPDVLPGDLPPGAAFSMVAGDFLDVYGQGKENFERWDVVVTCYFIDTAKNIMEYMEVIRRALKPGGVWINIGPLLYHFENSPGEFSIELSLEEVKDVACKLGFRFEVCLRCLTLFPLVPSSSQTLVNIFNINIIQFCLFPSSPSPLDPTLDGIDGCSDVHVQPGHDAAVPVRVRILDGGERVVRLGRRNILCT
ncbi:N2227-like protein-domain-containing protein [Jimgerdemannia flammicorona]|uniref:carnosine N-methyltransferase n=1 Tax=Jimgerdemannia flammicorona TaxID=994334 RepID=A0A433QSQ5_9FUNG|nr:N2227-like protein-domain-containing protein [Jimgerdemannia flammicorona]